MQVRKERTRPLPEPDYFTELSSRKSRARLRFLLIATARPRHRKRETSCPVSERYGLFSSAASGSSLVRRSGTRRSARRRRDRSPKSRSRRARGRSLAVGRLARGFADAVGSSRGGAREVPVPYRANPPGASRRARGARVAEDSSKIHGRSRDVRACLRAALLSERGGPQARLYTLPNRKPRPLGVAGGSSVNFPLLMLAWNHSRPRHRRHHYMKPAETTPLTALLPRRAAAGKLPAGCCRQHPSQATAGPGRSFLTADVEQDHVTGSTEVGKAIQGRWPAPRGWPFELGAGGERHLRRRAARPGRGGHRRRHSHFNRGTVCCAGSRLLVQESVYEDVIRKLKQHMGTLRVGDPLDKEHRHQHHGLTAATEKIRSSGAAAGEEEGAEIYQPPSAAGARLLVRAAVFTEVAQSHRIAQEEISGRCPC